MKGPSPWVPVPTASLASAGPRSPRHAVSRRKAAAARSPERRDAGASRHARAVEPRVGLWLVGGRDAPGARRGTRGLPDRSRSGCEARRGSRSPWQWAPLLGRTLCGHSSARRSGARLRARVRQTLVGLSDRDFALFVIATNK